MQFYKDRVNNFPNKNNNKNGLIKPVIMKFLTIIRIFYHNHDNFYLKNRCNSNNNICYMCNFYSIYNFLDKNNNIVFKNNYNYKWAKKKKTIILKIFTVLRIFIITMIIFTWIKGVILIITTAIFVIFTVLITFLIRTIICITWTTLIINFLKE